MAKQIINITAPGDLIGVGSTANDKKGDSLRAAFTKVNDAFDKIDNNFTELYTAIGGGAGTTDRLTSGVYTVILDANGVIDHNGSFTKTTNSNLANNVSTQVVWTSSETYISGAKLTIQVECNEGANLNWDTQVCEAVIAAKGYNSTTEPVIVVYGVTHTSLQSLMTFTTQRNPTTFLIEIVGTRTITASLNTNASLRIYSVETGTND